MFSGADVTLFNNVSFLALSIKSQWNCSSITWLQWHWIILVQLPLSLMLLLWTPSILYLVVLKALPDTYTSQYSATHICLKPAGFRNSLNGSVPQCIWIKLLNQYTKCGQFKISIFQPRQKFFKNFSIQTVHISVGKRVDSGLPTRV